MQLSVAGPAARSAGRGVKAALGSAPVGVLVTAALWLGCASVSSNTRIGVDAPSSSEQDFGPVANFLDHRCGSLDCHGAIGRNLRIWGCEGMRLDPKDISQCARNLGGSGTTPEEHLATYRSLVGLEPAVMSNVIAGHGQNPELLTFIRKARGDEAHKGGTLVVPGDPQDGCITSWLVGQTNAALCAGGSNVPLAAIAFPVFPPVDAAAP
jgi:hypothetical protein